MMEGELVPEDPKDTQQKSTCKSIVIVVPVGLVFLAIGACSMLALAITVPLQDSYKNEARDILDRAAADIKELEKRTVSGGISSNKAAAPVCLPDVPKLRNVLDGEQGEKLYPAEYRLSDEQSTALFGESLKDKDVPCVVCVASGRLTGTIFPARNVCYTGWHLEYSGYFMTSSSSSHTLELMCVDTKPEGVAGQAASNNNTLPLYLVEPYGQMSDPDYINSKELDCVVCTK